MWCTSPVRQRASAASSSTTAGWLPSGGQSVKFTAGTAINVRIPRPAA
jgi:hypothetical protein